MASATSTCDAKVSNSAGELKSVNDESSAIGAEACRYSSVLDLAHPTTRPAGTVRRSKVPHLGSSV